MTDKSRARAVISAPSTKDVDIQNVRFTAAVKNDQHPGHPMTPDTLDDEARVTLQFDLDNVAYARVQEILAKSPETSIGQLLQSALRLYEWYLSEMKLGSKIHVVRQGVADEVQFLFYRGN